MILVTDAASRIGSAVVRQLADAGHTTRALVPSRSRAARLESTTTELCVGSIADPRTLASAMHGVRAVVLMTSAAPEQIALQEDVIQAAKKSGVQRIVKLSCADAAADASSESARYHWRIEQQLKKCGIPSVSVRATRLMQALELQVPVLLTAHCLTGCQAYGRVADVDLRDVAGVLGVLATRNGQSMMDDQLTDVVLSEGAGRASFATIEVTGPVALSRYEVATLLSSHFGRHVSYIDCSPAELLRCGEAAGLPGWQAQDLVAFETAAGNGMFDHVTAVVQQILGRAPREFSEFAHEFAVSIRYSQVPGVIEHAQQPAVLVS